MRSTGIALNSMGNVRPVEINKIFRLEVGDCHFPKKCKKSDQMALQ